MRACLVFNPTARGNRARRFLSRLGELGRECELRPTARAGHAGEIAAQACRDGFDTVVAAGGDGTVSEVVDGIAGVSGAVERVRLGVIPLGTINVFARELRIPRTPAAAWQTIRAGRELRIDLPAVSVSLDGGQRTRHFVQLAGAGLDSRAIAGVDWKWKTRVGPLAYVAAGLRAWSGPQPPVTVTAGTRRESGQLVLIGNGRLYGGDVGVFPGASLRDGVLDIRVFRRVTWMTLARFAAAFLQGTGLQDPGGVVLQTDRFALSCREPLPVEVDGDNVGFAPAVFSVRREALRVLAP